MLAGAAHRAAVRTVNIIPAAGSVGVGAVLGDANPHGCLNIDVVVASTFRAANIEEVARGRSRHSGDHAHERLCERLATVDEG
jgi:hypothetical protein